MGPSLGRSLIVIGLLLVAAGVLFTFSDRLAVSDWQIARRYCRQGQEQRVLLSDRDLFSDQRRAVANYVGDQSDGRRWSAAALIEKPQNRSNEPQVEAAMLASE